MEHLHLISSFLRPGEEGMTAKGKGVGESVGSGESCGVVCAICLDKIPLHEMALVKGCEHAYCVTCILRWATYNEIHICPQCKLPFEFLNVHRSLDGSIHDYMFEESVCLLLRVQWFTISIINIQDAESQEDNFDELEEELQTEVNQEFDVVEQDESHYVSKMSIRIGNRRWGCNGYIRTERKEARSIAARRYKDDAVEVGPSYSSKEAPKGVAGRRAKRAMKRDVTNKATVKDHTSIS